MPSNIPRSWVSWVILFFGLVLYPSNRDVSRALLAGMCIGQTFCIVVQFATYVGQARVANQRWIRGELTPPFEVVIPYQDIGWSGILRVSWYMLMFDLRQEGRLIRNMYTGELNATKD